MLCVVWCGVVWCCVVLCGVVLCVVVLSKDDQNLPMQNTVIK